MDSLPVRPRLNFYARTATVIVHEWNEGEGVADDPVGRVYALRTLDGDLIATFRIDPESSTVPEGYNAVSGLLSGGRS